MKRNYIGFAKMGNLFGPANGNGEYTPTLPSGHFRVDYDPYEDALIVTKFQPKMDEILNLGSVEFNAVLKSATRFLSPEAEVAFKKNGYLLKRSFLFYGPPGTGKSVLSCKIADVAVESKNAIAIYPASYDALERMLQVLDETDKDRFKVISLEEFDDLVSGRDEASWTSLLDGQFQSANRLLLATTNHINSIPKRLLRPGRFSSLVRIPVLSDLARFNYLKSKGVEEKQAADLADKTAGFTVDDLKEVVQNAMILGEEVDYVLATIKASKALGKDDDDEIQTATSQADSDDEFGLDE